MGSRPHRRRRWPRRVARLQPADAVARAPRRPRRLPLPHPSGARRLCAPARGERHRCRRARRRRGDSRRHVAEHEHRGCRRRRPANRAGAAARPRSAAAGDRIAVSRRGAGFRRRRRAGGARRAVCDCSAQRRRGCARRRPRTLSRPRCGGRHPSLGWWRYEWGGGTRGRGWAADLCHRRWITRGRRGPRDPRRNRRRDHPGRFARRSGGVRGEPWAGPHPDRAPAAREWPSHRCAPRDARGRRVARARSVSSVAGPERPDGLHGRDARRELANSCPRTTRDACSSSRHRGPAASCSSRGRPGSSTAFSSGPGRPTPASRSTRSYGRAGTSRAPIPSTFRPRSRGATVWPPGIPRRARRCFATTRWCSPTSKRTSSPERSSRRPAAFVGERGGGLLVLGARSFLRQGLAGTTLEDVLPLDFNARAVATSYPLQAVVA